jgi:hypothetical protein
MRLTSGVQPLLALFGGTPSRSYVDVREHAIRFRFGWAFDQIIARAEIVSARPRSWPWWGGIGWRAWGDTVGLIGSTQGVVDVQLRTPRWAWLAVIPWRFTRIAVSLQDPDDFIRAMSDER